MASSPTSSSSTVTFASAVHSGSHKSDNTSPSSLTSSSSLRGSDENHHSSPRGRSNRKDPLKQEHICVVALLVREANVEDGAITIGKIQEIRRQFDQAHRRWLPHITLIPPFMVPFTSADPSSENNGDDTSDGQSSSSHGSDSVSIDAIQKDLEKISMKIEQVCRNYVQCTLYLGEIGHFPLRRYRTIHLRPLPPASDLFEKLQKSLESALPDAMESSRGKKKKILKETYKPHLTLGQSYTQDMHNRVSKLASRLIKNEIHEYCPIKVTVDRIQLMTKPSDQSGPYDIYREFQLENLKSI